MVSWNFLGGLLKKAFDHSTNTGKLYVNVLLIFRIFVLQISIPKVWKKEKSGFKCDTIQPGCESLCYDRTFPISHTQFWVLQIIFVTVPTLTYLAHALLVHKLAKQDPSGKSKIRSTNSNRKGDVNFEGPLLRTYVYSILSKILFEVGFIIGQYFLYGFQLKSMYKCDQWPCPNMVNCYVSRPTEKSVYIIFMLVMACVSVLLGVVELICLGREDVRKGLFCKNYEKQNENKPEEQPLKQQEDTRRQKDQR